MDDLTTLSYGSAHTQPPHLARPHGRGKPAIRTTTSTTSGSNPNAASAHVQNIAHSAASHGRHHSHPLSSGSGSSRAESRGTVQSSRSHDTTTTPSSSSSSSLPHTRRSSQASSVKERGVRSTQRASAASAAAARAASGTSSSSPPSHHHHFHHRSSNSSRRRGSSGGSSSSNTAPTQNSQQQHHHHHSRPHRHRPQRSTSHHTARHGQSAHSSRSASRKDEVIITRDGTSSSRLAEEEGGADAWPQRARSSSPSSLFLSQQQQLQAQTQPQVTSHSALPPSPRRQYVTDLLRDARQASSPSSSPSHHSPRRRSAEKDGDTTESKDTRGVGSTPRRPSRSVTFDVHPVPSSSSSSTSLALQNHTLVQREETVGESASDAVRALESTHNATQQQLEVVYRLYRRLRSHNASLEGEFRKLRAMLVQLRHRLAREVARRVQRAQQDVHALREFVRLVLGDYQDGLQHTQRVLLAVLTQPGLLAGQTPAPHARDALQAQYSQPLHRLSAASHRSQDWYKTLSPLPSYGKAAQPNNNDDDEKEEEENEEEGNDGVRARDRINYDQNDAHSHGESANDAGDGAGSSYRPPSSRSYRDWPALSIVRGNDTEEEECNNVNNATSCEDGVGGQTLQLLGSSPSPSAIVKRSSAHTPRSHRAGDNNTNYYDYHPHRNNSNTPMSIPSPTALLQLSSQPDHDDNNSNNSSSTNVRETLSASTEDNEAPFTDHTAAAVSYSHGEMRVRLAAAQKQVVLLSRKMAQSEQHWHARLGRLREIHMAREMALKEQVRLLQLQLAHTREPEANAVHEEQGAGEDALRKEKSKNNNNNTSPPRRTASALQHTAAELRIPSTNTPGAYAAGGQTAAVPPPPSAIRKAVLRVASAQDNLKTKAAARGASNEARRDVSPSLASQLHYRAQQQQQQQQPQQRQDESSNNDEGDGVKMSAQAAWARQLLAARGVVL